MTFDPARDEAAHQVTDSIAINQLQEVRSPSHGSLEQPLAQATEAGLGTFKQVQYVSKEDLVQSVEGKPAAGGREQLI